MEMRELYRWLVRSDREVSEIQLVKEKFQCQDKRFNFDLVSLRDSK